MEAIHSEPELSAMTREQNKLRLTTTVLEALLGESLVGGFLKLVGALVIGASIYYAIEKRVSFVEERLVNVTRTQTELDGNQRRLADNLTQQAIALARLTAILDERKKL